MKYIVIGIAVAIVIAIVAGIIFYTKNKKNKNIKSEDLMLNQSTLNGEKEQLVESNHEEELFIQTEILPEDAIDDTKLVEITDSNVLARLNNLLPGLVQGGIAFNNAAKAAKVGGKVYRAIMPAGAKLVDSKNMKGAVRGFYRGVKGIEGQANLVEVNNGMAIASNAISGVMAVASMVVGQYYMTQINAELGEINDGISQIKDFQDNEYRSKVFSLMAHVKMIADFQTEILENDELRLSKIAQLDGLEKDCTELLGQANLTLEGFAKKNEKDYKDYEKDIERAQNWFMYQKSLIDILYKISDLRYALHFGSVSREQCTALLPTYTKQVNDTQKNLATWHVETAQRLGIEKDGNRRKRAGFDGAIHFIPGLFNEDFKFCSIEKKTAKMISTQVSGYEALHKADTSELYEEDVQLISKNGKLYYLPGKNDK